MNSRGLLSVFDTQETNVSLPAPPARAATFARFSRVPYQQLLYSSNFILQSTTFCSPGKGALTGGCSEETRTCLSPVPSWPSQPSGAPLLARRLLPEWEADGSCQHSCPLLPGDPLLRGLLCGSLSNTVNQDPVFLITISPHTFWNKWYHFKVCCRGSCWAGCSVSFDPSLLRYLMPG